MARQLVCVAMARRTWERLLRARERLASALLDLPQGIHLGLRIIEVVSREYRRPKSRTLLFTRGAIDPLRSGTSPRNRTRATRTESASTELSQRIRCEVSPVFPPIISRVLG